MTRLLKRILLATMLLCFSCSVANAHHGFWNIKSHVQKEINKKTAEIRRQQEQKRQQRNQDPNHINVLADNVKKSVKNSKIDKRPVGERVQEKMNAQKQKPARNKKHSRKNSSRGKKRH